MKKFTLGATGDILLHERLYKKAYNKENDTFDFSHQMKKAKELFKKEHLIIVNQESIVAGKKIGLSDFPRFNSPIEIIEELKDLNVDLLNIANNHTLDYGEKGLLKSIENIEKIGIPYVGAHKSKEDADTLRIFNKNNLKVCFLSYTMLTGLGKVSDSKLYMINNYKNVGVAKLRRLIHTLRRDLFVDVVIVSMHFGNEYHMVPTSEQKEIARDIADAGADVILGHHPHVLQPPEYIIDSRGRKVFVAYSLGNFFSGQFGIFRQIGGYLTIDIEKVDSGGLKIDNPTINLTFVDTGDRKDYKIYLFNELLNKKRIKTIHGEFNTQEIYKKMQEHLTKWIPELQVK